MKPYGGVLGGTMKNSLDFGGDLILILVFWDEYYCKRTAKHMIVVVGPDRRAGNDPEALVLALHHHSPILIEANFQVSLL